MIIKDLMQENIDHVFSSLWDRGHGTSKAEFEARIGMPCTFAFYEDNEPCAIGFMEPICYGIWQTYFVATEEGFKKIALPVSLFFRRLSDQMVADGLMIISCSAKDETTKEWFKAIGFEESIDKYVKFSRINHAIGHGAEMKRGVLCAAPAPIK